MDRLRNAFEQSAFLLDLDAQDLGEVFRQAVLGLVAKGLIPPEQAAAVEAELLRRENIVSTAIGNSVAIPHAYLDSLAVPVIFFVRLKRGINMGAPDSRPTRYLFILVGPTGRASEHLDTLTEIARGMSDKEFRYDLRQALNQHELLAAADAFATRTTPARKSTPVDDGLAYTGGLAGGLQADLRRRLPVYWSDFRDGLHHKTISATLFLFFACVAPAITFGGLLEQATEGRIGAAEMLLATGIGGVLFSLLGGQPLIILGATGPHLIFIALLYELCKQWSLPFFEFYAAVGLFSGLWLLVLALTDASCLVRFFTRFTDEIFAALISSIYLKEAFTSILGTLDNARREGSGQDAAFLALLLSLGTFGGALLLSRFRKSRYLSRNIREFLADFGPTLAITAMLLFAQLFPVVPLDTLQVPERFEPTYGAAQGDVTAAASIKRPWLIPLWNLSPALWLLAALVAVPVTVLTFLEQNISARIVNSPDHQLRKGPGYHLDLFTLGVIRLVGSPLGLPWIAAAAVRCMNHVRALATVEEKWNSAGERREEIIHVIENRLSGLAISVLIGASLLLLPWLKLIPIAVLYGLFLYMGFVSLSGNQFFERLMLWITDPELYPKTHYTRTVPRRTIHLFTAVQAACFAFLFWLTWSPLKLVFPLFIAALIPIRQGLNRLFLPAHLAILDEVSDSQPEEPQGV
jgi:mannitol/fructose-specific phosphotransferase system IIA component (Ntr-type)